MMENAWFLTELIGKTILIKTHLGQGTKDVSLIVGDYKGTLLGFDGKFIRIEYDIKKFTGGSNAVTKDIILINVAYVITVEEYRSRG